MALRLLHKLNSPAAVPFRPHTSSTLRPYSKSAYTQRTMSDSKTLQKYIVVFKDGVTSDQISKYVEELNASGGAVKDRWDNNGGILNGFSAGIPDSYLQSLKSLQGDVISYIEPDGVVTIQ